MGFSFICVVNSDRWPVSLIRLLFKLYFSHNVFCSRSLEYDWELQSVNPLEDSEGWKNMERWKLVHGWSHECRRPGAILALAHFFVTLRMTLSCLSISVHLQMEIIILTSVKSFCLSLTYSKNIRAGQYLKMCLCLTHHRESFKHFCNVSAN